MYSVTVINDYVTGLCIYCTVLFYCYFRAIFLLTKKKKKFAVKQYAVLHRQRPHTSHVCLLHLFSLGLYLISCCFYTLSAA